MFFRLKFSNKGHLTISGFSEPADADADDIELWYPRWPLFEPTIGVEMAKYVIANVGDRFCELVEQEKEAMSWVKPDVKIAWKRAVQGVREMCDVCDTTLFNMHWVCHKCGFVACIDCYRLRKKKGGACADPKCKTCTKDGGQRWLTCSANRQSHEPDKLMITQIIPSDALWVLGRMIHEMRDKWGISANCPCGLSNTLDAIVSKNGLSQHIDGKKPLVNGIDSNHKKSAKPKAAPPASTTFDASGLNGDGLSNMSPLSMLAEAAASRESSTESSKSDNPCSTLRDLLTRQGGNKPTKPEKKGRVQVSLDDLIQKVAEGKAPRSEDGPSARVKKIQLQHYVPKNGQSMLGRDDPIPTYTLEETQAKFPDVKHAWLDGGRLLRLMEPHNASNINLFQQQWRRAQVWRFDLM